MLLIKEMCQLRGPSGDEGEVRSFVKEHAAPYADKIEVDNMGSVICWKYAKENKETAKTVYIGAHMDEVGFMVQYVMESGLIRYHTIGGIDPAVCVSKRVFVGKDMVPGVIGCKAIHLQTDDECTNPLKHTQLYIDIGARNKKDALRRVSIGDFFVVEGSVTRLMGKRVMGRPLDDRIGCVVLLDIAERLSSVETKGDVYYVFSVQEEVGCRGSMTSAFAIAPNYSLCFDVTGTGDTIGASAMACKLGGGAAVKIKDSSVICSEEVVSALCRIAEEKKIPYQREILTYGGTDTSSMQLSGSGSLAGALSIPTRYIHSGVETCDLSDAEACAALAVEFIKELN